MKKGEFLDRLHTVFAESYQDGRPEFELTDRLRYASTVMNGVIEVPNGFRTDFASVPRMPVAYLYAGGVAPKSATVHDWLYKQWQDQPVSDGTREILKDLADRVFLEALEVEGIGPVRRRVMYQAVSWFGGRRNPAQWVRDEVLGG